MPRTKSKGAAEVSGGCLGTQVWHSKRNLVWRQTQSSLEGATTIRRTEVITQCKHTSGENRGVGWTPGNPKSTKGSGKDAHKGRSKNASKVTREWAAGWAKASNAMGFGT